MKTYRTRIKAWAFIGIAATATCIALPNPAEASEKTRTVTATASAAGLDLNTPEGVRTMYSRLRLAAHEVCSTHVRVGLAPPTSPATFYTECFEDALGRAIRSVAMPQLTIIYLRSHTAEAAEAHGISVPVLASNK